VRLLLKIAAKQRQLSGMPLEKGADKNTLREIMIVAFVPSASITSENAGFKNRHLWGSDLYTADSDLVAILHHEGYVVVREDPPSGFDFLKLTLHLRRHDHHRPFPAADRNYLRSRPWSANYDGFSLAVVKVEMLGGPNEDSLGDLRRPDSVIYPSPVKSPGEGESSDAGPPWYFRDSTFCFTLSNEPCLKYSIEVVADRGLDQESWTSYRLRTEVLLVENGDSRFELSACLPCATPFMRYRWAQVRNPHLAAIHGPAAATYPLGGELCRVVEEDLDWHECVWSEPGVTVRGIFYPLSKVSFARRVL